MGVPEKQLLDLPRYDTSPAFQPVDRLVLDLAVAMAKTPADVPHDLVAKLREQFDEPQLIELTAAIAWEHYRARFNRVFAVQPAGYTEGSFCALPER